MSGKLCVYLLVLNLIAKASTYAIPDPKVQLIEPKGLRISIPHESGIVLVGFHVNIDKLISLFEVGDYSTDLTEPTDDDWVFENTEVSADTYSKVNYWLHVQYENNTYRKLGGALPLEAVEKPFEAPLGPLTTSDCERSATTVNRKAVCKGELVFEDNFNTLNPAMWQREVRMATDADDGEFVSYQARSENCYINQGVLHIVPNLLSSLPGFKENLRGELDLGPQCTGINNREVECKRKSWGVRILPPVVSARIRTKNFFNFRYGKVEVRAKMPKGDWLFPLILLEPLENYYGATSFNSGQMRVAFMRGNENLENREGYKISGNRIAGGVVLSRGEVLRDRFLKGTDLPEHLGDDFHVYTLTWTADSIILAIDGDVYARQTGNFWNQTGSRDLELASSWKLYGPMAPFDREFYLTLGVAAGGHSDFPEGSRNPVNGRMKPWMNNDHKAEIHFWRNHTRWYRTWNGENAGLHVDYIKVYAL